MTDSGETLSVYHLFMDGAYEISNKVLLITPARFLFDAGHTPSEWNRKMLADRHFEVLEYEVDSSKFFQNIDIKGGIAIHYRDSRKFMEPVRIFTSFLELNSILLKVKRVSLSSLSDVVSPAPSYRLSPLMLKENPDSLNRLRLSCFTDLTEIFYEAPPQDEHEYVQLLGLLHNECTCRYVRRDYLIDSSDKLDSYKVFVPKSNGSGAFGEVLSTPLIGRPLIGHTQSFISIGRFDTESEADACCKYICTKFCRALLGLLKATQDNPPEKWKYVPLQDFTVSSDIDWTKSVKDIDGQLYRKYKLTVKEIDFIETHVQEMDWLDCDTAICIFESIVPMICAYSAPDIERQGWIKIGYMEQDVGKHLEQQTHMVDVKWLLEWKGCAIYDDSTWEIFTDSDFRDFLRRRGIKCQSDKGIEWFFISGDESLRLFNEFRMTRGAVVALSAVCRPPKFSNTEPIQSILGELRSKDVVRSGFMSDYLFRNIYNVFDVLGAATGAVKNYDETKDSDPMATGGFRVNGNGEAQAISESRVKDRLRRFARAIPVFLMACGTENDVTLANFDRIIPEDEFKEVTGITLQEFRLLRDGGSIVNEDGAKEYCGGHLFDEAVFDGSVKEFMALKKKLSNYFEEASEEDIFDYIPPQKTNQAFTPKKIVVNMVDRLESENPGCFDDGTKTFADLYMTSGLYIAEIVKRLYRSKRMKLRFPDDRSRLAHIFSKQIYGLAPTEITYRICKSFLLGFSEKISIEEDNIRLCDPMEYIDGDFETELREVFYPENRKRCSVTARAKAVIQPWGDTFIRRPWRE